MISLVVLMFALSLSMALAAGENEGGHYYTVQYGDTLFSIGRHYSINPYRIAAVNGLSNPDRIYAGQKLYIPAYSNDGDYPGGWDGNWNCYNGACTNYKVTKGDTLFSIGRHFGINPYVIAEVNGLTNPNFI